MVFLSPVTCILPVPTAVGVGGHIDCNCAKIFRAKAELSFFNRLPHYKQIRVSEDNDRWTSEKTPRPLCFVQTVERHIHTDRVFSDFLDITQKFKIQRTYLIYELG